MPVVLMRGDSVSPSPVAADASGEGVTPKEMAAAGVGVVVSPPPMGAVAAGAVEVVVGRVVLPVEEDVANESAPVKRVCVFQIMLESISMPIWGGGGLWAR